MATSNLSSTERYAAGALLALALRQAQIHQTHPLGTPFPSDEQLEKTELGEEVDEQLDAKTQLWTSESCGLLRPVFRFLDIDPKAWSGIEETAESSSATKHHKAEFLRILSAENNGRSSENMDQELALVKAIDAMTRSLEASPFPLEASGIKHRGYDHQPCEKSSTQLNFDVVPSKTPQLENFKAYSSRVDERCDEKSILEGTLIGNQRNVGVLFELLSACVADTSEADKKHSPLRKGYDARHRVALKLLATWLNVKWINMEAMEIMVACSAMAAVEEKQAQAEENETAESEWSKWKRGGIIGAAALTGGTLLAITGGLAAPAIAAGFSALAPTLGTLVPVIGASGFAAVASAAGSVAGSVAVAASFGAAGAGLSGSKMAKRIGNIDEFEFTPVGENHNQGHLAVGILVSGFVFEKEDFVRPWEGRDVYLERYALQWESKNLISVSTAIEDWLTSKVSMELMKQGAMLTVLNTLVAAIAWPATLLSATNFIDSKWSIAVDRSDKAGKLLAEVLLKGLQGNRPVTLIGFSLGARVIFKCLQHLAETGDNEGIVERVVLLGAPISLNDEHWETARKVVAGRFINAYSTNDWMLGIAFRASLLTQGLAGIQPITTPGFENVDVTELIEGHSSYLWTTHKILEQLDLDNYYPASTSSHANPQ